MNYTIPKEIEERGLLIAFNQNINMNLFFGQKVTPQTIVLNLKQFLIEQNFYHLNESKQKHEVIRYYKDDGKVFFNIINHLTNKSEDVAFDENINIIDVLHQNRFVVLHNDSIKVFEFFVENPNQITIKEVDSLFLLSENFDEKTYEKLKFLCPFHYIYDENINKDLKNETIKILSKEKGFSDIFSSFREILELFDDYSNRRKESQDIAPYYKSKEIMDYLVLCNKNFYNILENQIKKGVSFKAIIEQNHPKFLKNYDFVKLELKGAEGEFIKISVPNDVIVAMKESPYIGKDGINLIYDVLKKLDSLSPKIVKLIYKIISYFKVPVAQFMKLLIKYCFQKADIVNFHFIPAECSWYNKFDYVILNYLADIEDTINMATMLKRTLSFKETRDINIVHDNLACQIRIQKNKIHEKLIKEKSKENKELLKYAPTSSEYILTVPESVQELFEEGDKMHHCVGSYAKKVVTGQSKIYFLRKKKEKDNAYVTVELDCNNEIVQAKSKYNNPITKEDTIFLEKWVNNIPKVKGVA